MSTAKVIVAVVVLSVVGYFGYYLVFPHLDALKRENPRTTAFMEYRKNEAAAKGKPYHPVQVWMPLSRISPYLVRAVLIAEDDKFWQHEGFDYEAIRKAIEKDIAKRKLKFGGSTISQQLAKNLFLSPSKNPVRKVKEAMLTWRLERTLPKKRILELYLNVAEWGDGIFGAEAAARRYWGISAAELNPDQASRLAASLPSPLRYNPLAATGYVASRAKVIQSIMKKRGIIDEEYGSDPAPPSGPGNDTSGI